MGGIAIVSIRDSIKSSLEAEKQEAFKREREKKDAEIMAELQRRPNYICNRNQMIHDTAENWFMHISNRLMKTSVKHEYYRVRPIFTEKRNVDYVCFGEVFRICQKKFDIDFRYEAGKGTIFYSDDDDLREIVSKVNAKLKSERIDIYVKSVITYDTLVEEVCATSDNRPIPSSPKKWCCYNSNGGFGVVSRPNCLGLLFVLEL